MTAKRFRVVLTETRYTEMYVQAASWEEASDRAVQEAIDGPVDWVTDQLDVGHVEEVSEDGSVSVEALAVSVLLVPALLAVVVFTARMFGALAGAV